MKLKLLALLIAFLTIATSHTHAMQSAQPSGITVSPAFQQVTINQTESEHPISFNITNNQNFPQTINLSSADFNTLNESGGLLFVGSNPTELQKKYGLAKWLKLPQSQLTLQPKQTVKLAADILNLASMPAGGHYGALMLSIGATPQQTGGNNVSIQPVASSLLFVTKLGGDTHKLSLSNVYVTRSLYRLPSSVDLRFYNDGNTHLIPRGTVTIYDANSRLVSKGIINEDSGIVLPGTYRRYSVQLNKVAPAGSIGQYTLQVDFRFDGTDQYRRYQQSFWVVPQSFILATIFVIVIIVALLFAYKKGIFVRRPKP